MDESVIIAVEGNVTSGDLDEGTVPVRRSEVRLPTVKGSSATLSAKGGRNARSSAVVPSSKSRSKVPPAGTVNALVSTVVHLTASSTSSRLLMVPVQSDERRAMSRRRLVCG